MRITRVSRCLRRVFHDVRGQALIETALTLPLVLLLSISVVEFGRAFQCWELLTNAAREGARIAVLPGVSDSAVQTRVQTYLTNGQLTNTPTITVVRNTSISIGAATTTGSTVTVTYPFTFMALRPLTLLVDSESGVASNSITMHASSTMRNE
jgi:Flp pilus assembly protein TadG